jgi:aryl-alcohol dehydrogenase-like predicted oxidoreductase
MGVSDESPEQMDCFLTVTQAQTVQPPCNHLERQTDGDALPDARETGLSTLA